MEISEKTDLKFKLLCVELAAREMIDVEGEIDLDKVFTRARDIYDRGHLDNLYEWKPVKPGKGKKVEETPEKKSQEKSVEKQKPLKDVKPPAGTKVCPNCGEYVPEKWKKHSFKRSDGSPCGHVFSE